MSLFKTKHVKVYGLILLYKLMLEISFYIVLTEKTDFYKMQFDPLRFVNETAWCMVTLMLIQLLNGKASSFFLLMIYTLQIIPISVVYAFQDIASPVYYNLLMVSFLMGELFVNNVKIRSNTRPNQWISQNLFVILGILSAVVLIVVFLRNGLPSLAALSILDVYEFRSNLTFQTSKIIGYLLASIEKVALPIIAVRYLLKKEYLKSLIPLAGIMVVYLYTGQKSFLFSIPLILIGVFFLDKKGGNVSFFKMMLLAYIVVCTVPCVYNFKEDRDMIWVLYSLFVRRVLIVPAYLKFIHYDYFLSHPFLGLYGAIPRVLNPYKPKYYENGVKYPFDIGAIYFDKPNMSADTGALIEGFSRFGYMGLIGSLLLIAIILKQIDRFQERTSYREAICYFIYIIYSLSEMQIVGTLFLGAWMFSLIIINLYMDWDKGKDTVFASEAYKDNFSIGGLKMKLTKKGLVRI